MSYLFLLQVIFIKMRRDDTSKFKGSIFVEFATQEMANNFLQQDLAIDETVLEKMTRYEQLVLVLNLFYL